MSQSKFPGLLTVLLAVVVVILPVHPLHAADLTNDALWQEAQQLEQSESYDQAADRYQAILSSETRWKKRAKAALLAANCLDRIGRSTESIPLLDRANRMLGLARRNDPLLLWSRAVGQLFYDTHNNHMPPGIAFVGLVLPVVAARV